MYSYIQRYALSQWSKCCGLTRHYYNISVKKYVFLDSVTKIVTHRKNKRVFLIGYYIEKQLPQQFWIQRRDRKVERLFTKIQLQQFSYGKYSSRMKIVLRQNLHIGICNGAAMEEAIWKGQSTRVWKKKGIAWHIDASSVVCVLSHSTANPIRLRD